MRRGNYEAALPLLERVVVIEQANYGPKDARLAVSLNNLALLQGERGAWRAAEPLLARAVAIEEEALGRDSPELIATLENRAAVLERLDRREEAAAARHRAAAIRVASTAVGVQPAAGRRDGSGGDGAARDQRPIVEIEQDLGQVAALGVLEREVVAGPVLGRDQPQAQGADVGPAGQVGGRPVPPTRRRPCRRPGRD